MENLKLKEKSSLRGRFRLILSDPLTKEILHIGEWQENIISNADTHGHNLFIRQLGGDDTYPLAITRARFGTTNVDPTEADSDIDSPFAYDIEIADTVIVDENTLRLYFFAPSVYIDDDTYYTFATYCGTQTFSMHLLDSPFVKAGNVDTTIEYEYFINNVTGS